MKYTEEQIEIIAKSMYKAVKTVLTKANQDKGVVEDVLDPNFVAEAANNTPPPKQSQMNKSKKVINKTRKIIKNKCK